MCGHRIHLFLMIPVINEHIVMFSISKRQECMYSKYSMDSFFTSKMHVCSCIGLQICTYVCEGIQICIPRWKSTILYTLSEDYKFVHLHRGLQICTPLQSNTNLHTKVEEYRFWPLQRITNLYTFTEDYKTNLHTFTENYKFVHLCKGLQIILCPLLFTHMFIDRCTLDHCHGVPPQPLLRTSQTDHTVAVYCDNYSRETVIGKCTQVFDQDIEISWMEGTYTTVKLETLEDQRPSKSPQNNTMDRSCAKRFNYSFQLCTYFH